MLSSKSNEEMISSLRDGQEKSLHDLSKKYYQSARRWLRRKGIPDSATPGIFAKVLVTVYRDIQQSKLSVHVDLDKYLFNMLTESLMEEKEIKKLFKKNGIQASTDFERDAVVSCFTILDDHSKKLLSARYNEKLSFEEIASRFDFSNPVIAEFEFQKALNQFQQIAQARLNKRISS